MANRNFLNQMRGKTGSARQQQRVEPEATKQNSIEEIEETPVEPTDIQKSKSANVAAQIPSNSVFDVPDLDSLNLDDDDNYEENNQDSFTSDDNNLFESNVDNDDNNNDDEIKSEPEPVREVKEVIEEKPRRRGRPRNQNVLPQIPDAQEAPKEKSSDISNRIKEQSKENKERPIRQSFPVNSRNTAEAFVETKEKPKKSVMHFDVDGETPKLILIHVCKQTISNLLKTYKSSIYTQEFAADLFNKFINDETSASTDALFKALITECIEKSVVDEYLGPDLTIKILTYIQER